MCVAPYSLLRNTDIHFLLLVIWPELLSHLIFLPTTALCVHNSGVFIILEDSCYIMTSLYPSNLIFLLSCRYFPRSISLYFTLKVSFSLKIMRSLRGNTIVLSSIYMLYWLPLLMLLILHFREVLLTVVAFTCYCCV